MTLTDQQKRLYSYLRAYMAQHGTAPTLQQQADAIGLKSKSGCTRLLNALEERGYIRRLGRRARAIEILVDTPDKVSVKALISELWDVVANNTEGPLRFKLQQQISDRVTRFFKETVSRNNGLTLDR